MKTKLFTGVSILLTSGMLVGCGKIASSKPSQPHIYQVKVTSVVPDDKGKFIVKGTTNAPQGTKVFAQSGDDDVKSNDIENSAADWLIVNKKGHFTGSLDTPNAIEQTDKSGGDYQYKPTDSAKIKFFASSGVSDDDDSMTIPKKVREALKEVHIKPVKVTIGQQNADYWNNLGTNDSSADDSSSQQTAASSSSELNDNYQLVFYDDLARHPKKFFDKPVEFRTSVLTTQKKDGLLYILTYADGDPEKTIIVKVAPKASPSGRSLKHHQITVKGKPQGLQTYTTSYGGAKKAPVVEAQEKIVINGKSSY